MASALPWRRASSADGSRDTGSAISVVAALAVAAERCRIGATGAAPLAAAAEAEAEARAAAAAAVARKVAAVAAAAAALMAAALRRGRPACWPSVAWSVGAFISVPSHSPLLRSSSPSWARSELPSVPSSAAASPRAGSSCGSTSPSTDSGIVEAEELMRPGGNMAASADSQSWTLVGVDGRVVALDAEGDSDPSAPRRGCLRGLADGAASKREGRLLTRLLLRAAARPASLASMCLRLSMRLRIACARCGRWPAPTMTSANSTAETFSVSE